MSVPNITLSTYIDPYLPLLRQLLKPFMLNMCDRLNIRVNLKRNIKKLRVVGGRIEGLKKMNKIFYENGLLLKKDLILDKMSKNFIHFLFILCFPQWGDKQTNEPTPASSKSFFFYFLTHENHIRIFRPQTHFFQPILSIFQ